MELQNDKSLGRPHDDTESSEQSRPDKRRHGRLRCCAVQCSLGEVIDMSASGMRILSKRKVSMQEGTLTEIRIGHPPTDIKVRVRIVWKYRRGFRQHEIGVEYDQLTPSLQSALCAVARSAAKREIERTDPFLPHL